MAQAAREARQALALNPSAGHNSVGIIYDHLGMHEAAGLRESQRALEIDPTNTRLQARLVEAYELYGKFDEAIDAHQRFFATPGPTLSLMAKGRLDEAQPLLEEAIKKNSGDLRASPVSIADRTKREVSRRRGRNPFDSQGSAE